MHKIKIYSLLVLLLFLLTGCSYGRKIDTSITINSPFKDGSYSISTPYMDSLGFYKTLSFNVTDGIITDITYTETNKEGQNRLDLPLSYLKWSSSELNYSQILQQLYEESILTQSSNVDAIAGATKTVEDYKLLLSKLIKAAEEGDTSPQTTDILSDTYTAINAVDPLTSSQQQMTVVYKNGKIDSVEIEEIALTPGNLYSSTRLYSQLADISSKNKSLDNIYNPNYDSTILTRYNDLLEQIRIQRGI